MSHNIYVVIVMVISMFVVDLTSVRAEETVVYSLSKPLRNCDGVCVGGSEIIKYVVDISDSENLETDMRDFNIILETVTESGDYSNLVELQGLVNRSIRNNQKFNRFRIIDVFVDEK